MEPYGDLSIGPFGGGMKISKFGLFFSISLLCFAVWPDSPVGEKASYLLDVSSSDRTSWMIENGVGEATVAEYRQDEELGPSYVISIDYEMSLAFYGDQKGSIGLLVPAEMLEDGFYQELVESHPKYYKNFTIDFIGRSDAVDALGNSYDQCFISRIHDVDPNYRPFRNPRVLWKNLEGALVEVEDVEIYLRVHPSIGVLGAVQIDVSGTAMGFDLKAGFDLIPSS